MGSEGRLWAALAKLLAQKDGEQPRKASKEESLAESSEEDEVGFEKGPTRRQIAKAQ